jgi:hypothetical protein
MCQSHSCARSSSAALYSLHDLLFYFKMGKKSGKGKFTVGGVLQTWLPYIIMMWCLAPWHFYLFCRACLMYYFFLVFIYFFVFRLLGGLSICLCKRWYRSKFWNVSCQEIVINILMLVESIIRVWVIQDEWTTEPLKREAAISSKMRLFTNMVPCPRKL